jgi:ATP-dependent exoDNAse (exonuclease V) beta subunit
MKRLIRASAGSGKTFQLSGHFLRQLFLGHRPETILATTFTRKAAGEILGRVLLRLADAAEDPKEAKKLGEFLKPASVTMESSKALLADVTRQLHRLRVCTLDSFFQQVARSLTLELGLPPGWSIVDEHTDRELREQAIDAVLSQHVPQDAQQLMQMLAKGRSKRSVRDLIDETVTNYHELYLLTDDEAWNKLPKYNRLTQPQREQALRDLYAAPLPSDKRFIKARAEDMERFQAEQWDEFVDKGLASKVLSGDEKYYGKTLNEELVEIYQRLLTHAKAELLERLALQMKAIRNLMTRFDSEYTQLRSEHGWLRFNDVTRALARSAGAASGPRMSFRLDSSIRNLLLDEFQDTSSDQWQILRRLTHSLQQHDESSFFCVGDGKQAIYGWRGGVAAILDAVEEAVPGVDASSLDTSRRSSPAVMEAVNQIFTHVANHPGLEDYNSPCVKWGNEFPPHSTANTKMPGYVCFRTSPIMEGDSAEERRGPWYRWVAEQIRDLHLQTPGADIGVLTRKNSAVARLVHELSLLNVPASEEGGTPPTDSPAVLALLSLLHLTSHPSCEVSRFHVACSQFGTVVGLRDWKDQTLATTVAAGLRARLLDEGYGKTLQWLSESVRDACSARDVLRLQQVVAQGWLFDASGSLNPCDFIRLLENSKFQKSEPAPVRVMTVHQSKGLEFDVVVLPELDGDLFRSPQAAYSGPSAGEAPDRVCVWSRKAIRPLLPESLQTAFDDTIARQVSESLCVFYVALTRAKHSMHLLTPPMMSEKSIPKSYAGLLLASLTTASQAPPSTVMYETGDPEWFRHVPEVLTAESQPRATTKVSVPLVRLSPMHDGRRRGLRRRAPSRHDETRLYLPEVTTAIARRESTGTINASVAVGGTRSVVDARTRGIVMHGWFECIEWIDDASSVQDESSFRKRARELSVPETIVDLLMPDFQKILEHSEIRAAFDRRTAGGATVFASHLSRLDSGEAKLTVERERTFVMLLNGELVQGTIDRLVLLYHHGRPVAADIVDFKTDRLVGNRDLWIQNKRSHYGPQLGEYRTAVSHCFGVPATQISTRLLLLEADAVVET